MCAHAQPWGMGIKKWQARYRTATTAYPCYIPVLGEFSRSWSYRLAVAKIRYLNVVGLKVSKKFLVRTYVPNYINVRRFVWEYYKA